MEPVESPEENILEEENSEEGNYAEYREEVQEEVAAQAGGKDVKKKSRSTITKGTCIPTLTLHTVTFRYLNQQTCGTYKQCLNTLM